MINFNLTRINGFTLLFRYSDQFLFNYFIPDHQADAFRSPLIASEKKQWSTLDVVVQKFFEGFTRWDSQYFLHVAQFGYTYEHMTAFFPGYPIISGTVAATLEVRDIFRSVRGINSLSSSLST